MPTAIDNDTVQTIAPGAVLGDISPAARRHERRNYVLTVVNGIMTGGPSALFDPSTVIPAFIIHMHGSTSLVGIVSALVTLGWIGPQIWVANWIEPKPRKLFVYHLTAGVRIGTLAMIAAFMWFFRANLPPWFLYAMIGLLFLYWSANGFSAVGWYEVVSKTIPSERRPVLFAWRQTGAGVVTLIAGLVISWALSPRSGMAFPVNYFFLLALMTVLMAVGIFSFCAVREPADSLTRERRPWGQYFLMGARLIRVDANYRRLLFGQLSFSVAIMVTPFLVPYLMDEAHVDDSVVGMLMAIAAGVDLIANVHWGQLGSRRGNRAVLVQGSRLAMLAPVSALGALLVPPVTLLGIDSRVAFVALALVMSRIAASGIGVGRMNYLLDIAPQGTRPSYIGFLNTFSIVSILVPVFAGRLIESAGYLPVFVIAACFGIVTTSICLRLDDYQIRNGRVCVNGVTGDAGSQAHRAA